jgi:hypothetical protein
VQYDALRVTDQMQAVEREKAKQREADDALTRWSSLSTALGDMEAELQQGVKNAQGEVVTPPADSTTYRSDLERRAARLFQDAFGGAASNPNVQRLLERQYLQWRIHALPAASLHANRLFMDEQEAALTVTLPREAERLAGEAEQNPATFQSQLNVTRAWILGKAMVKGQAYAVAAEQKFVNDVMWNIARRRIDANPGAAWTDVAEQMPADMRTKMQEYQASKKREAEAAQKRQEAEAEANFREVQKVIHAQDQVALNDGTMDPKRLEDIAAGRDEFYPDPSVARTMQKVLDNPPEFGGGATVAQTVMDEYDTGAKTVPRIEKARAALNHALGQSDRRQPAIIKALQRLQDDEASAKAALRGERNTVAAERAANIAAGVREVEANRPARAGFLPAMLRRGEENRHKADLAELRRRVGNGEDYKKVSEEIKKRNEQAAQTTPPAHRKVQELPE